VVGINTLHVIINFLLLNEVRELTRTYSNNMELGKQIRQFISNKEDEWKINQFNRNRAVKDQISTIQEMEKRVEKSFND